MWLKQSTLVFLTVAVAAMVVSDQDPVTLDDRKPKTVKVPFGSPLNLKCNLNTAEYEVFRVVWRFNPFGSSFNGSHNISTKIRFSKASAAVKDDKRDPKEIVLPHTSSATDKNSGWYFCEVTAEIPKHIITNSNGTEVVITKSVEHATHPSPPILTKATVSPTDNFQLMDWWLWIMLGVSAFILIVLLVICVLLRRRYRRIREDPIYVNTRPVANKQPSPRPGMPMDTLKTVSSSQNLRNQSPGRRYEEGKRRYKY